MKIREYDMKDYDLLKQLMDVFTSEMGSDFDEKRFRKSVNRRFSDSLNNKGMIIAEEGKKLIGMVFCEVLVSSSTVETYGNIASFVVDKEYRNKGTGNALIEQAVNFFTDMGVTRIETNVRDLDIVWKIFIERDGFRKKYIILERSLENIKKD